MLTLFLKVDRSQFIVLLEYNFKIKKCLEYVKEHIAVNILKKRFRKRCLLGMKYCLIVKKNTTKHTYLFGISRLEKLQFHFGENLQYYNHPLCSTRLRQVVCWDNYLHLPHRFSFWLGRWEKIVSFLFYNIIRVFLL